MQQLIDCKWQPTRRKAQDCGNTRVYATAADRNRAIKALIRSGFRYFVCFRDIAGIALQFCKRADWQQPGDGPYVSR